MSHANGGGFVRREHQGSPLVVVAPGMPSMADAQEIAAALGLQVVGPSALLGFSRDIDEEAALEDFYLIAMDKQLGTSPQ